MSVQVEPRLLVAEKGITALKRQRNSCYGEKPFDNAGASAHV